MFYCWFRGGGQSLSKPDSLATEGSGRFFVLTDLAINRFKPRTDVRRCTDGGGEQSGGTGRRVLPSLAR